MANGSGADNAQTTCGSSSYPPSFLRDLIQISITVVVTCIVLAVYRSRRDDRVPGVPSTRATLMARQQSQHGKGFRRRQLAASAENAMSSLILEGGQAMNGAFLSSVVALLWHHLNVAVSNSIKEILDPLLTSLKVPMHFVKLDLGDIPIRTENMFVHPRAAAGAGSAGSAGAGCAGVQIDLDLIWDGNPDVMLQATLLGTSGSKKSANVTFGVKRIKLTGRMHILLSPLTTELPVVSAVQYGFTNPPQIELEFAGFAQSIAKQFAFVEPAIMSIVQSSLASMLVLPYRMIFPIDLMSYDYLDTYQPPVGMIRISVESGRGFTKLKKVWGYDIPDIYCMVSLGGSSPFRTSTQWNNVTPSWLGETCDFVLYDLDQKIYVQALDDGLSPIDSGEEVGRVEISARHLFTRDSAGTVELELTLNNLPTGCYVTISAEMFTLSDRLHSLTSSNYEGDHHVCGVVAVIVTRAFDVPLHKEDASTYVKVVSGKNTFVTPVVTPDYPDNLDPVYSSAFYIPLTVDTMKEEDSLGAEEASSSLCPGSKAKRRSSVILTKSFDMIEKGVHWPRSANESKDIVFTLMNDNSSNNHAPSELGSFAVTHDSLLRANNHTITEIRKIGPDGASLGFRVVLSGMQSEKEKSCQTEEDMIPPHVPLHDPFARSITESECSSNSKKQSIRVTALKGRGFTVNVRNLLIGTAHDIHDIYCCIRLVKSSQQHPSNSPCWRTSTITDDTMPNWNEVETFATTDTTRDSIRVDAYNENRAREDEFLGSAEYPLNTLLRKRLMEVELKIETKPTGSFITLKCVAVSALAESDSSSTQRQSLESNSENDVLSQLPTMNLHEKVPRHKIVRKKISSIPRVGRDTLKRTVSFQLKGKNNISPEAKIKACKSFS